MSNFNSKPIDIVVPWVNPADDKWFKDYSFWKTKCSGMKTPERIRDLGNFPFWFRSLEKNMPWVRYVFLILSRKSQIPSWLNCNHPKLKIVFQEDYIPDEYNPTFNSFVCTMFLHKIKGLSDNFIYSNDDMIFCKLQKEEDYFINDKPVREYGFERRYYYADAYPFHQNVRRDCDIIKKITGAEYTFNIWHTNFTFKKSFIAFMWKKFENEFSESLKNSKFRQPYNITDLVFDFAQQVCGVAVNKAVCKDKQKFFRLTNTSKKESMIEYMNKYITVCFNDDEHLDVNHQNEVKKELLSALKTVFPNKSEYEL